MKNYITRIINVNYDAECCYNILGQRIAISRDFERMEMCPPFTAIIHDRQVGIIEEDVVVETFTVPTVVGIVMNGGVLELSKKRQYELAMAARVSVTN